MYALPPVTIPTNSALPDMNLYHVNWALCIFQASMNLQIPLHPHRNAARKSNVRRANYDKFGIVTYEPIP